MTDSVSFLFANRDRKTGDAAPWAKAAIEPDRPTTDAPRPVPVANPKAAAQPVKDAAAPPSPKVNVTVQGDAAKGASAKSESSSNVTVAPSIPKAPAAETPIPLAESQPPTIKNVFGIAPPTPIPAKPDLPPIPLADSTKQQQAETFALKTDWSKVGQTGGFGLGGKEPDTGKVSAFDRPISAIIVGPNPLPVKFDKAMETPATTPRASRGGNEGAGTAQAIAARFTAVIGALYALSAVLNSTGTGATTFQKSLNLLGSTLAPILMPVFLLLASGIMTLSDIIWSKMLPALGGFYDWLLKFALPVAAKSTENASNAATGIANIAGGKGKARDVEALTDPLGVNRNLADLAKKIPGINSPLGKMINPLPQLLGSDRPIQIQRDKERDEENRKRADRGEKPLAGFGDMFNKNLDMAIKSLSLQIGPKASYTGLGEAAKSAQLAALNADPVELEAANRIIEALKQFQNSVSSYLGRNDPKAQINRRYSDGSYEGPTGARVR